MIAVGSLAEAIAVAPEGLAFALDPASDPVALPPSAVAITVCSGPEGGLTGAELELLLAGGFVGFGLGPRILRAETAPVIAVALARAATASANEPFWPAIWAPPGRLDNHLRCSATAPYKSTMSEREPPASAKRRGVYVVGFWKRLVAAAIDFAIIVPAALVVTADREQGGGNPPTAF